MNATFKLLVLSAGIALILSGCTTTKPQPISYDQASADSFLIHTEPGEGLVPVEVFTTDRSMGCNMTFYVDGKPYARLAQKSSSTIYLPEGVHVFAVSHDINGKGSCFAAEEEIQSSMVKTTMEVKKGVPNKLYLKMSGVSSIAQAVGGLIPALIGQYTTNVTFQITGSHDEKAFLDTNSVPPEYLPDAKEFLEKKPEYAELHFFHRSSGCSYTLFIDNKRVFNSTNLDSAVLYVSPGSHNFLVAWNWDARDVSISCPRDERRARRYAAKATMKFEPNDIVKFVFRTKGNGTPTLEYWDKD